MPVMLIMQTRVKPDKNGEFERWLQTMKTALADAPGFIKQEDKKPNPPVQLDWIVIDSFDTVDNARKWLQSLERFEVLQHAASLLAGINTVYIMEPERHDQGAISATITNKIAPENEEEFLAWQMRIAPLQARFPGYLGYKIERPKKGVRDTWTTVVTFDTESHLEAWLQSHDRVASLKELATLSGESTLEKIYSGFNFWSPGQRKHRAVWKENMLVLLTLYPIVFLLSFPQRFVMVRGVPFWLALFFSNLISTVMLGNVTVPWLMAKFQWWLNPPHGAERRNTFLGVCVVVALYLLSIGACWLLSR